MTFLRLAHDTKHARARSQVTRQSTEGLNGRVCNGAQTTECCCHLPWPMKNLVLHVLFEQGIVGLGIWTVPVSGALWRTTAGAARRDPLAPVLAAAIARFLVVGFFDSLLDVHRLSWLFYFLLLVAWTLRGRRSQTHLMPHIPPDADKATTAAA